MGQIRSKAIKKTAFLLVDSYPDKVSGDFDANKKFLDSLTMDLSKGMRNRVAGYVTRVFKRQNR